MFFCCFIQICYIKIVKTRTIRIRLIFKVITPPYQSCPLASYAPWMSYQFSGATLWALSCTYPWQPESCYPSGGSNLPSRSSTWAASSSACDAGDRYIQHTSGRDARQSSNPGNGGGASPLLWRDDKKLQHFEFDNDKYITYYWYFKLLLNVFKKGSGDNIQQSCQPSYVFPLEY